MKTLTTMMLTVLTICLTNCSGNLRPKTAEELKAELKLKESSTPQSYLWAQNVTLQEQRKEVRAGGLFRDPEYAPDGAIIQGDIVNKASIARFKDLTVIVSFYSQTQTLIDKQSYIIYEYYEPNTTKHFSMKITTLPQAYKNFSFGITGATPAD